MRNGSFLIGFIGGIIGMVMAGLWMFVGMILSYGIMCDMKKPRQSEVKTMSEVH